MDAVIEFIKWCFRSGESTVVTIIVLGILFNGIESIVSRFSGKCSCQSDDDD